MRRLALGVVAVTACATTSGRRDNALSSAMVVGTIHEYHLSQPAYPMTMIGAVLIDFMPDLVLVEIRPEAFATSDYEDGPLEMTYVTELAMAHKIPVEPIDWWRDSDVGKQPQLEAVTRETCEQELVDIEAELPWPVTFEGANGSISLVHGMRTINVQARCYSGNADWNRRQAWMEKHAEDAIRKHNAKHTLVVVGSQHRGEMELYLHALGLQMVSPTGGDVGKLRDVAAHAEIPQAVISRWRDGLVRLKTNQRAATGAVAIAIAKKIDYWQKAIDTHGRCCIEIGD